MSLHPPIPYDELETLFLDVGNTLISIDFSWVRDELEACGVSCRVDEVRRAEAAARPKVSAELERLKSTESTSTFSFYVRSLVAHLPAASGLRRSQRDEVADKLAFVLQAAGKLRLWSYVLPGVRATLQALRQAGLKLVVVSNSDGTVEEVLVTQGLRSFFHCVLDSYLVGYEKPDPRLFFQALERSGANPERTLHVGDLYDADVVGARAASLHALLLDPFDDWPNVDCERLPDLVSLRTRILSSRKSRRADHEAPA